MIFNFRPVEPVVLTLGSCTKKSVSSVRRKSGCRQYSSMRTRMVFLRFPMVSLAPPESQNWCPVKPFQ